MACIDENPPTPGSLTEASEPPVTITSALPQRSWLKASIMPWFDEAQAETIQ